MEQSANEILRLHKNFLTGWGFYVKNLTDIYKSFEKMQRMLKAVTTGRVYSNLRKPLLEIDDIVKKRGVSSDDSVLKEIEAALAASEEDTDED